MSKKKTQAPAIGDPFLFEGHEYQITELPGRNRVIAGRTDEHQAIATKLREKVAEGAKAEEQPWPTPVKRITMSLDEITWLEPDAAGREIAAEAADWISRAKDLVSTPRTKEGDSEERAAKREADWDAERKGIVAQIFQLADAARAEWATRSGGAWMLPMRLMAPVRARPSLDVEG